jgi:hypothetical protein
VKGRSTCHRGRTDSYIRSCYEGRGIQGRRVQGRGKKAQTSCESVRDIGVSLDMKRRTSNHWCRPYPHV